MSKVKKLKSLEKQHKTKEMYDQVKGLRNVHLKVEDLSQIKMEKYYLIKKKLIRDGLNILKSCMMITEHQCHNLRSHQDKAF